MAIYEDSAVKIKTFAHSVAGGMEATDTMLRRRSLRVVLPADAAAADATPYTVMVAEAAIELLGTKIVAAAALTANDTNYATLTLGRHDAAGGATTAFEVITTKTTGGGGTGNWVEGAAITLTIDPATDTLTAGQALSFEITKTGTGVVIPDCVLDVQYRLL